MSLDCHFLEPFGLSFEPVTHPAYKELVKNYDQHIESSQSSPREADVSVAAA
jgi:hypothetical protein